MMLTNSGGGVRLGGHWYSCLVVQQFSTVMRKPDCFGVCKYALFSSRGITTPAEDGKWLMKILLGSLYVRMRRKPNT